MSTGTHFRSNGDWAFVPGPADQWQPMNSQDVQDIEATSPEAISASFLSYPGMLLLRSAHPTWVEWRARWESGLHFIEIGISLFEDEAKSWGGSEICADCPCVEIEALWMHLQSFHRGIWLHDLDCIMHTRDSFRTAVADKQTG